MTRIELRQQAQQRSLASYITTQKRRDRQLRLDPGVVRVGDRDPLRGTTSALFANGGSRGANLLFNASLPNGSPVSMRGSTTGSISLDARSTTKRQTQIPAQAALQTGKIKGLCVIKTLTELQLYVFGWKPVGVLAKSLPESAEVIYATIDNLGRDAWSISLAYRLRLAGGILEPLIRVEQFGSDRNWAIQVPGVATGGEDSFNYTFSSNRSVGFGFFPVVQFYDTASFFTPSGTGLFGTVVYNVYNGKIVTRTQPPVAPGSSGRSGQIILLPGNPEFTEPREQTISTVLGGARWTLYKVNQGATVGIGTRTIGTEVVATVYTSEEILTRPVVDFATRYTVPGNVFFDLQQATFSGITRGGDGVVEVDIWNYDFQRLRTEQVLVYPPDRAPLLTYSFSYNPL